MYNSVSNGDTTITLGMDCSALLPALTIVRQEEEMWLYLM